MKVHKLEVTVRCDAKLVNGFIATGPEFELELIADIAVVNGEWCRYDVSGSWHGSGPLQHCLREIAHAWRLSTRMYLRAITTMKLIEAIEGMPDLSIRYGDVDVDAKALLIGHLRGEVIDRCLDQPRRVKADAVAAAFSQTSVALVVLDALAAVESGESDPGVLAALRRGLIRIWTERELIRVDANGNVEKW